MNPFTRSAQFYDRLYDAKKYPAEVDYVAGLIQRYTPGAQSILDLGCGTGRHAIEFAQKSYAVVGVDRSSDMLSKAEARRSECPVAVRHNLLFRAMDIRALQLAERFDAVVALFHVVSYQTSNEDVKAVFAAVKSHLRANGVFVFDCWYGPGVLADPPVTRVRRLQSGLRRVLRIAEPTMNPAENIVDVNYQFVTIEGETKTVSDFVENHRMRYFFIPELWLLLEQAGLKPDLFAEWMSEQEPTGHTWNITVVARHA